MKSAIANKTIDRINDIAGILNKKDILNLFTDEQLQTLSRVFNQLGNKLWKHRNDNRAAYRRNINGREFPDA